MDLKKIKAVLDSDLPDELKEGKIIEILSQDRKVIPILMNILSEERYFKDELIDDMNLQLGKADVYIQTIDFLNVKQEGKQRFNKAFVLDEIEKFYSKYKGHIIHLFKAKQ